MKILLIAGHGAGDSGAIGVNGLKEADLTRDLVKRIAPELKKYAQVDIRDINRNAYADAQIYKLSVKGYDYVFEVHFNAFNSSAYGTECYVTGNEVSIDVEQSVMRKMKQFFVLRDNDGIFDGVKRMNFSVIATAKAQGVSGCLLETCFIDNAKDMTVYQASKDIIAKAIAEGIAEGFKLKKANQPLPPAKPIQKPSTPTTSISDIAKQVLAGKFGNGEDRKNRLVLAGYDYAAVQSEVNKLLGLKSETPATPSPTKPKPDQILVPGSKVKFPKLYKIAGVAKPSFNVKINELAAYLAPSLITERDANGVPTKDQRVDDDITNSYCTVDGTWEVESVGPATSAYPKGWIIIKGWGFKIKPDTLEEI